MAIERVRSYFKKFGMDDRILEFDESSATAELSAALLGVEIGRIAKTLSFYDGEGARLIVISGDARVDNGKYKERFGARARMLTHDDALKLIGHEVGGVCPFAVNDGVKIFLDDSLRRYETVFPAAGSSKSAIELFLEELEKYSRADGWVNVGRGWQ